tara:strand:+ start:106 stop:618 length:513 start_codon:yes stop_codon:yes gene_type:complete
MKRALFLSIILGCISPIYADSLCTLTSEEKPDVNITMKYVPASGGGKGTLNYQGNPKLYFRVGLQNGYGGQYYVARSYTTESLEISYGRFMNFVGNQLGRVTSKEERKPGKLRALMPTLARDYYYSIPFTEKGQYGRQKLSKEMKTIIDASEGFFVNSGGCRKFFAYGWD